MNAKTWVLGFFFALLVLSTLGALSSLVESLMDGGPRVNIINGLRLLVFDGVLIGFYGWLWRRARR